MSKQAGFTTRYPRWVDRARKPCKMVYSFLSSTVRERSSARRNVGSRVVPREMELRSRPWLGREFLFL